MDELARLTELCRRLGADAVQADTLARQLCKRADQLAVERAMTREAAMDYLLRLVVEGRSGTGPNELPPPASHVPGP
jgi:hypothetical protein